MTKRFRGRKHVFFLSFSSFSLVLMLLYVFVVVVCVVVVFLLCRHCDFAIAIFHFGYQFRTLAIILASGNATFYPL